MSAIDRLNKLNSGKYKDAYTEAVDTIDGLIRRVSMMTRQVSYLCVCDIIKFTCRNGVEFHLVAGKVKHISDETKFRLYYTDKSGDNRTLYNKECSWRRDEWFDGVAENLVNKMIEVNSDEDEVISNILCKGNYIDSIDFYYFNFINEMTGHAGYNYMKEFNERYDKSFIRQNRGFLRSRKDSADKIKTVMFIDMLNKVSISSSIMYKDMTLGNSNILFKVKAGDNTICGSLDNCKTLMIEIKSKNGKTIGHTDLSNYIYCQSLDEVLDNLARIRDARKLDHDLYYSLLSLDEEHTSIELDDYPEHLKDVFKKIMGDIAKLFTS